MLWAIAVSMKLKLITMKKTDFGFSGEKPVLCLQPRRGAAGTSRPGGNFPFASHTSSLGSCSISEKPGTAGLWDDSCSCVTVSLRGHLFSLRLQQEGGKKHLKHMQEQIPQAMLQKGKSFPRWTSNEEAEPCFAPERCS